MGVRDKDIVAAGAGQGVITSKAGHHRIAATHRVGTAAALDHRGCGGGVVGQAAFAQHMASVGDCRQMIGACRQIGRKVQRDGLKG